jgi:hypothetical protein
MRTNDLLLLIRNLSKADKKSFTMLAEKQDGANYLFLYKELEKILKTWNALEDAKMDFDDFLEKKIKRKGIKTSLATLRTYTADMILKSLRLINEDENKRDEIESRIKNAAILENRGMLQMSMQMLNEALSIAMDYQYHALAMDILVGLVRVESHFDTKTYGDSINDHLTKIKELVSFLGVESSHYIAYYHCFLLLRSGGLYNKREPPVGTDVHQPPSTFLSRLYYYQELASDAILKQNSKNACVYSEKMLDLWHEKQYLKEDRLSLYVRHVANYLTFCSVEKDFRLYKKYIDELTNILQSGKASYDLKAELEQNIVFAQQLYCLNTNQIEAAVSMFTDIERVIKEYKGKITTSRIISFHYNHIIALFALSELRKALNNCINMLQIRTHTHRYDLRSTGRVLQIILFFELKDHKNLDMVVKKLAKLFKNAETGRDFERIVLRNLYKLAKTQVENLPIPEKRQLDKQHFENFYEDLLQYKTDAPSTMRTGFDEIFCWVQSKVEGVTYREILKRY